MRESASRFLLGDNKSDLHSNKQVAPAITATTDTADVFPDFSSQFRLHR